MATARLLGIDVCKGGLDVASRPDGRVARHPNTPEGIAAPIAPLKADPPS